ncbi:MAG: hypothetical protein ABIN89_03740 [Chitinophagaceae bacterium]
MKILLASLFVLIANFFTAIAQQAGVYNLTSKSGGWSVTVDNQGAITQLSMQFNGKHVSIPWRQDEYAGPAWSGVTMTKAKGNQLRFEGSENRIGYTLEYKNVHGKLTLIAQLINESDEPYLVNPSLSLRLGIDHEMKDPKKYFSCFFPTLLRCESSHFWGYFQNPNGQILTIASPNPIASRNIGYISHGHRIATSSLDFLHVLPLPPRHPQNLFQLLPGEKKEWNIVLQQANSLKETLAIVAANCNAPMISLDRTTSIAGELIDFSIYTNSKHKPTVTLLNPFGKKIDLPKPVLIKNTCNYTITGHSEVGNYKILVTDNNKQTEALFHIRKPWGWYLGQAREEAFRMQIKPMSHREGWLGFFSTYWAQVYFPDEKKLVETERIFHDFYVLMIDSAKVDFYINKPTWNTRPQNTSWMVGMLVARYAATQKMEDLELAAAWGDRLIEKFQLPNGAFKGYTALTLGAKFLQELAFYEKRFTLQSSVWKERYERHLLSIKKATEDIMQVKDLGDTEGEATYEDTQAGSAWSLLALAALNIQEDTLQKKAYLKASIAMQQRHECLTQALIPDGRMRNATLRFWESQYDVLTLPNMMNSPHGWTMRSQFGALYLYLLTGDEYYLNVMNNAMGACVQAIDEQTGILRWAFIPDPYINALPFVPDTLLPGSGTRKPSVIGEQWLPMISDWWRIPDGQIGSLENHREDGLHGVTQGWSCDNDVHESFRVLTEEFIPNAFVLERKDGSLRTMNCQAKRIGYSIYIYPNEAVVSRVHLNLKKKYKVVIQFAADKVERTVEKGMHWISSNTKLVKAPDLYLGDD